MELYAVVLPRGSRVNAGASTSQQQALQALLGSDVGSVESLASEPGEQTFTVEYPDEYAAIRAAELKELSVGLGQPLPYHAVGTTSIDDRYVTVSRSDVGPIDPRSQQFQRVRDLTLSEAGTIASHWREVATHPVDVLNPFGSDGQAPVGVPAMAAKVRWFDAVTGQTAEPTVQATRTGRLGDVDILDATAAPFDAPNVIFELDYANEGETDPRLWDARGEASMTDGNSALLWQKVFATSHRFEGDAVLENGLIRLTFDEPNNSLTAERWDDGTSSWSSVSLGASDWELYDVDVRNVGLAQVGARVEFRDPTASPTAYHTLSLQLTRGGADAFWTDDADSTPSGLVTKLDPIAETHTYDPYGSIAGSPQALRAREEVN